MRKFCWFLLLIIATNASAIDKGLYDVTVLRTVELRFNQSDWWQQLINHNAAEENIAATLIVDGLTLDSVGVRFRGNTSYSATGSSKKKSFNIELDWVREQNLLGYTTLNLLNGYEDPTFMREVLYSNACRTVFPSARANFVKLLINGENWGVYANVQQLDGIFIREWFSSNNGSRWRGVGSQGGAGTTPPGGGGTTPPGGGGTNPPGGGGTMPPGGNPGSGSTDIQTMIGGGVTNGEAALTWQGTDTTTYSKVYSFKSSKEATPWQNLIKFCDVLNNTGLSQLPAELEKVLNVDEALWLCAFEILFEDDDGYVNKRGSDYYLYHDQETGRFNLMQFDGNASFIVVANHTSYPVFYRSTDPLVPIMYRLMSVPEYRQRYLAHVRTILNTYLTEAYLWPQIDALLALIETEVKADTKKLYSNQQFDSGVLALRNYITSRRAFLLANAEVKRTVPNILSVNEQAAVLGAGYSLTVMAQVAASPAVKAVRLFVADSDTSLFASTPMYDDGLHGDSAAADGVYGSILTGYPAGTVLRYYVQAMANDAVGAMAFKPEAEHLAYEHTSTLVRTLGSPVLINEIMAQNSTTLADPQGEFDDWIELFNTSNQTVDLSGMYLSDDLKKPLKWKFPDSTTIAANEYLLVWADENGKDSLGLHASFKLSASGERVLFSDRDTAGNALLDSVTFGSQTMDVSFGRLTNSQNWFFCKKPTPGQANAMASNVAIVEQKPESFQLYPAFPNPFNATTTVLFTVPSAQRVSLRVYDATGRQVKVLYDDVVGAGRHRVAWEAANVPSGVYFVRMIAGSFSSVHKVLLLK
jgi:hypothetical protein